MKPQVTTRSFGMIEQQMITQFTICFEGKLEVQLINYGGIITSIKTPDRKGEMGEVILGYASLSEYMDDPNCMGAAIGRNAGRIKEGKLQIGGYTHQLSKNEGKNQLHGGLEGFNAKVWKVKMHIVRKDSVEVVMEYTSKHGEEGYPGELTVTMHFNVTVDGLSIRYHCISDQTTWVNLTHHPYFNLKGSGTVLDHQLMVQSEKYIPVDEELIPLGTLKNVNGTPFDFRKMIRISDQMDLTNQQLSSTNGFDHTLVLQSTGDPSIILAEQVTGRKMEVLTDMECVQVYTSNAMDGSKKDRMGKPMIQHGSICLEPQAFPDATNQAKFPCKLLQPNETHQSYIAYHFSTLA